VCVLIGYDDREAVKLMTVPGSIVEIEEFITANFPGLGDEHYFGQMRGKTLFKLPPGHAAKLKSFVSKIQSKNSALHSIKPINKIRKIHILSPYSSLL